MKTYKGTPTGGLLAISGKSFECKIGDNLVEIKKQNPDLSDNELQIIYEITREQIIELDEQDYTTED